MTAVQRIKRAACLLLAGAVCLPGTLARAAEEPNEAVIEMVAGLLGEKDRDMRALGLQQVREEVPGPAATKRFAALLPKLPAESQAGLLDALGDRGDATARPAVLEMLKSDQEAIRAAAVRALGPLGSAAEVPLLAGKAAAGSEPEKKAARQSLARLRGEGVNAALVSAMAGSPPAVRVAMLGTLAARNAKETLPTVLKEAEDPQAEVRLAALGALRFLAGEKEAAAIVKTVKAAKDEPERRKAELALLAICSRTRQMCAAAVVDGLADADPASRVVLLRCAARAGGPKALEAIVARLDDGDETVRDEALRMLSSWPDAAAAPRLLSVAEEGKNLRHRVLAIRGLVRLAGPRKDEPADLEMLGQAMKLASRPEEKRLVLGALGDAGTPQALALVTPAVDDPALAEDACLAAVMIAEREKDGDKGQVRSAMEKVAKQAKNPKVRERAEKVLKSL